ncbi:MAG TPA: TIGR02996 domain-containing protein [Gemmataceae bacterium]|jgi:uncharacterized protein (TIGR02996 family)
MPSTHEQAFLRAIIEYPDDDASRLIYADWLEENGDAGRAEFIRMQVELARLAQDSPRRRALARRARELLEQHQDRWVAPLQSFIDDWRFCRGFVERVELMGGDLEEWAEQLFASTPVRRLWATDLGGAIDCLQAIPARNRLSDLDLNGNDLDTDALTNLARQTHLGGIRVLSLLFNRIDDDGARVLCTAPFFQNLSLLHCGANPLTAEARQMLQEHFGDRVSFALERDADHLYAFQDDYAFVAGFGNDDTQLLFLASQTEVRLAIFDHAGNLLDIRRRAIPQQEGDSWQQRDVRRQETRAEWLRELAFHSATIKVKRFRFDDVEGVYDFNWWAQAFDRPGDPEVENLRPSVERWLMKGQFEYNFGGANCWLDRSGEVTDT